MYTVMNPYNYGIGCPTGCGPTLDLTALAIVVIAVVALVYAIFCRRRS